MPACYIYGEACRGFDFQGGISSVDVINYWMPSARCFVDICPAQKSNLWATYWQYIGYWHGQYMRNILGNDFQHFRNIILSPYVANILPIYCPYIVSPCVGNIFWMFTG